MRNITLFRRALTGVLASSLSLITFIVVAPAASAAVSPVLPRADAAVTGDALPTLQLDNPDGKSIVWTQAILGGTVYAGGTFTNVKPAGGTTLTPRGNLVAYDITTGALVTSFAPALNATVKALTVSPNGKVLYVGGAFTTADGGVARNRIAAYDTATGKLISTFKPSLNATVTGIAATDTTVYVAGFFGVANNVNRTRLAAFTAASGSASDGTLTTWAPTADADVNAMTLSPDKTKVVIGGAFQNVNGTPAQGITALTASSGALQPWPVNQVIKNGNAQSGTFSLSIDSDTIYGTSYNYGTGNFEGQFAMRQDGSIKWLNDCHGDTYSVFSADNGIVYGSGHAHFCSNIGGFPESTPRKEQRLYSMTREATGTVQRNTQNGSGYGDFEGQPSPSLFNYFPQFDVGTASGSSQSVWSLTGNKQYLAAGGEFPKVNGKAQYGLVRFAIPSIAPNKVGPTDLGGTTNPTVAPIPGYGARVGWKLNWDYDDTNLTYKVVRADKATTPLYTTTLASSFWQRPIVTFVDKTATAGNTYRYRIIVNDPSNNLTQSDYVSVTMPTTTLSPYGKAVLDDGATNYWRLGDADQPKMVDLAGGNDLVRSTGVVPAAAGAISGDADTSATFDGTSAGTAGSTSTVPSPDTFSAEAWFKTTTTRGGKIVGLGNSQTGTSTSYDRQVYMDNAGRLRFGVYPGSIQTVSTAAAYNDGAWHHVVAQMSSAGMVLWVDGVRQGANPTTTGQPYNGYWRVGGDNVNAWTGRGASDYFAGQIDDVAIYPTALTVTQVRNHFTASGRTVNLPAAPKDAYGQIVFNDSPTLFWRLDETAGPAIADTSPTKQPGVASGGVTYGSASPVSGAPGTALTFNGSDGALGSQNTFDNPTVYTEEVWFKTTTDRGGKLIGFGSAQTGRSGSYDRHVYMDDSGRLTFGTYTGQLNTITSPQAYNDGTWHHVVASQGADGMKLYVDGVQVGTNPQTGAEGYTGYWRVGGDSTWGGSSAFLAGTIDEVAVYPTVLTPDQVRAHYNASPAAKNAAPVASFTADACTDGACTFDASASSDPDGSVADYAWDFGDQSSAAGAQAQHSYTTAGTYTVTLTVTDDRGATTSTTKDVVVAINRAPVASFTASCAERVCAFDGGASSDPDGTIAGYLWSFGDGTSSTEVAPSHTYAANGTYSVGLTVTDDQGRTTQTVKQVAAKANATPVADIAASCSSLSCDFDASGSSDSDGSIVGYAWNFGDSSTGSGSSPTHAYAAAGTYTVTLRVTDDKGAVGTTTRSVTVSRTNVAPTASFTSTCTTSACSFDASGSSDSDGTVASYAWDFGDGTTGTGATPSHPYTTGGTYTVKLTVTDDDGATNATSKPVTVEGTSPTVATDQFSRTGSGWGSADAGGAYTLTGGATPFSTNGSAGLIKLSGGTNVSATLASTSAADVTVYADVTADKVPVGTTTYVNLVARKSGTSSYVMKVRFMADGTMHLAGSRITNGSETTLKEVVVSGLTYTPGTTLRARFTVSGTSTVALTGKLWKASATEPTTNQFSFSDSTAPLQSGGSVGLSAYLPSATTNAPIVVTVDNLSAVKP